MGDEPYAALLPWMVFAMVDRARGDGPLWASIAALIAVATLLLTSSRERTGSRNVILLGAIVWFAGLAVAGALHHSDSGLVADNGRALSAAGFAVIAFASLAFTPAVGYYTRPHVRSSSWDDPAFTRVNVLITLIWAVAFTLIASAHFAATALGTPEGYTVFNWVVPLALGAIAAHRSRVCWDDFNDEELSEVDPMHDLALDWESPPLHSTER
jgi:hypothetical protein